MRKLPIFAIFFLIMFVAVPLNAATYTPSTVPVYAEITNAYYADLNLNGLAKDVRIELNVTLNGFSSSQLNAGVQHGIYVGLVLPSGLEYWYDVQVIIYKSHYRLALNLYNHATESGWYTAYSAGYLQPGQGEPYLMHSYIFDPPGIGSTDKPPTAEAFLI